MYRPPSSNSANDIDVAALWHAIWDRKLLIIGSVLAVGVATYSVLSLLTPQYTSEARILIDNDESAFTRPTAAQPNAVPIDPEAVVSQVQVLLSRDLAFEVIRALELTTKPEFNPALRKASPLKALLARFGSKKKKTPEDTLERVLDTFYDQLDVSQVHKSRVISVRVTTTDRTLSAVVANKLAETYLAWQQRDRIGQTKNASNWLRDQIALLRRKVDESEAAVARFRSESGIVSVENDVTLSAKELSELNSQLILAKAQRSEAEARARLIYEMLRDKGEVDASPDVLKSELIRNLLEQRVTLQRLLAETSASLLPSHPRIKQLRSELADLRSQIRQEARKIVKSLESEAQIAGAREASIAESLKQAKSSKTAGTESEIKLRGLEREAQVNRELLESYLTRHTDASARDDLLSVPAYASIISRAGVSRNPSFPKKKLLTGLAMAASGFLLVAFFLTRELIVGQSTSSGVRRTEPSADFIEVRDELRARYENAERPAEASPEEPSFDVETWPSPVPPAEPGVVTTLDVVADLLKVRGPGLALVAPQRRSADTAGDALALARSLARAGDSVILVDLPETSDELSAELGFSGTQGLGELAAGVARFEDVVRKDPKSPAHIMVRGHPRLNPAHNGEDEAFSLVLTALDQTYDYVLLHTNGSAAQNVLLRFGEELESIVLISDGQAPAEGRTWSELEQQLGQAGLGAKVVRFARRPRQEGVWARLPMVGRAAAV